MQPTLEDTIEKRENPLYPAVPRRGVLEVQRAQERKPVRYVRARGIRMNRLYYGDCLTIMRDHMSLGSVDLIYLGSVADGGEMTR